ncbi:MAG: hypothetical protein ACRD25_02410, partial [Terracidiphilus sp.]
MDEENYFESRNWRPFGTKDAARIEAQMRRSSALGQELWGRRSEHLERQLQLSHPEIPSGFALEDFLELLKLMNLTTRYQWARSWSEFSQTVSVGAEQLTRWEARRQVVI